MQRTYKIVPLESSLHRENNSASGSTLDENCKYILDMQIFYINLDNDKERRESMERQLSLSGLNYERMPAVYGRELNKEDLDRCYSRRRALRCQSRELTFAEIGIALSHIHTYHRIVEQHLPYAIVLEDDVILPDDFRDVMVHLESLVQADLPEILLLSPATADCRQSAKIRSAGKYQASPFAGGFFASSYIITRSAAQSLLRELSPVSMVADNWVHMKNFRVVDLYVLSPCLIEQDREAFGSSTNADYQPFSSVYAKVIYKLRRFRCVLLDLFQAAWRRRFHPYNDVLKAKK